jgi:hypothetical protein
VTVADDLKIRKPLNDFGTGAFETKLKNVGYISSHESE